MQGKVDEVKAVAARGHRAGRRADDAVALPDLQLQRDGRLPPADLRDLAVFELRPLLSRVPGVANVEVLASEEREISVIVDPARLNAAKLTIDQVADALKATNQVVLRRPAARRTTASTWCSRTAELHEPRRRAEGRRGVPRRGRRSTWATSPRCARA